MTRRALILLALLAVPAHASESYHPPTGGATWQRAFIYLDPIANSKAAGVIVFASNASETEYRAQLYARGLVPRGYYTLWLVTMNRSHVVKTQPISSRWHPARPDASGVLSFTASLSERPPGNAAVLVKFQPGHRPAGFQDGITVLKGYLATMK